LRVLGTGAAGAAEERGGTGSHGQELVLKVVVGVVAGTQHRDRIAAVRYL
jgi:hypothetical protein